MEAARHIVQLGASKLIIAVRSTEKGEAAKRSIEQTTKCNASVVEVWPLDLCSYASVKAFASRASKDLPRIDVLLEDAGVAIEKWEWAEGNEKNLTVNCFSTFLLAFLLLPKLRKTAVNFNTRPNITIVTSDSHFFVDFDERTAPQGIFNRLNEKSSFDPGTRYPTSKLLGIYIVREMAAKKPADTYPVTINTPNPGLCQSELARDSGLQMSIMKFFLARTTEVGSRTLVHAAGAGAETHGGYLNMCQVARTASVVEGPQGREAQRRIWDELMVKLDEIEPGVSGNL